MKKKLVIGITIVCIVLACLLALGFLPPSEITPQDRQEAIQQAQQYQSDGNCTLALVPAVHKATGAKYTFRSGCLAPGWEPDN